MLRSGKIWKEWREYHRRLENVTSTRHLVANSYPLRFPTTILSNCWYRWFMLVYVGLGASLKLLFQNNLWPDLFDRYRLETAGPTGFEIVPQLAVVEWRCVPGCNRLVYILRDDRGKDGKSMEKSWTLCMLQMCWIANKSPCPPCLTFWSILRTFWTFEMRGETQATSYYLNPNITVSWAKRIDLQHSHPFFLGKVAVCCCDRLMDRLNAIVGSAQNQQTRVWSVYKIHKLRHGGTLQWDSQHPSDMFWIVLIMFDSSQ